VTQIEVGRLFVGTFFFLLAPTFPLRRRRAAPGFLRPTERPNPLYSKPPPWVAGWVFFFFLFRLIIRARTGLPFHPCLLLGRFFFLRPGFPFLLFDHSVSRLLRFKIIFFPLGVSPPLPLVDSCFDAPFQRPETLCRALLASLSPVALFFSPH